MTDSNQSKHRTAFTVSIEAKKGVTTGISAKDRAHTIKVAVSQILNQVILLVLVIFFLCWLVMGVF